MGALLKKEFCLAMHPTTAFMLLLSAMVLIPNYPYLMLFFYVSMAIFFTCLSGRENKDILYSLNLPVPKSSIVKARFLFAALVQLAQLALMVPFALLSQNINKAGNGAGMDANIALFALGFLVYGFFNFIFFVSYYKNVNKVGAAFAKASVLLFLCAAFDSVSTYTIPFVKNYLDTKDPAFLLYKLLFLAFSLFFYAAITFAAYKISAKSFEKQDLNG